MGTKKQCPPLTDCLHSEAVLVHPLDCCKDGNTACKKKRCPTLKCHLKLRAADTCCPRCAKGNKEEQAAVREEQASRREQRLRRLRRIHRSRRRQKGSSAG